MTADRTLGAALGALAAADVAALMASEVSIPITIAGVAARGIVREYFGDVPDPRNPEIYVATADVPAAPHRKALTIGAETFTIEAVRPVAPGLCRILLA